MKRKAWKKIIDRLYPIASVGAITNIPSSFSIQGEVLRAVSGSAMIQITLSEATDLDCQVRAEEFHTLLSSLEGDEEVVLSVKGGKLQVGYGKAKGWCDASGDIEPLKVLDFDISKWVPAPEGMMDAIDFCRYAASKDSNRGVLCGVLVDGKDVVGADGLRIAALSCKVSLADTPLVLSPDVVSEIVKYKDSITHWAIKGPTIYFKIDEDTILAGQTLSGDYPEEAKDILRQVKDLDCEMTFPDGTEAALSRHDKLQTSVASLDREVEISCSGNSLKIASGNRDVYAWQEPLSMSKRKAKQNFKFKVHPAALSFILSQIRKMRYSLKSQFVGFKEGKIRYITAAEWVKGTK